MTYLLAMLAGATGAIAGYFVAAALGWLLAIVFRMSDFEGAAGYFVAFVAGPVGLIAGLVLGMYLVLRFHGGHSGFAAIGGRMLVIAVAIGALVAVGILLRLASLGGFSSQARLQLLFELQFPSGMAVQKAAAAAATLESGDSTSSVWFADAIDGMDGRFSRRGGAEIAPRSSNRLLVLTLPGEPDRTFRLEIEAMPGHDDALGPWQRLDLVKPPGEDRTRATSTGDAFEIRYRVRNPQVEFGRPIVEFELNLPASTPLPDDHAKIDIVARYADNQMKGVLRTESWKGREGDRVTLHGIAQMAGPSGSTVEVRIPGGPAYLFEIATTPPRPWPWSWLKADAPPRTEFGPWRAVDQMREPGAAGPRAARETDDIRVRHFER